MTNLLLRLFVKNYKQPEEPAVRGAIGSLSGIVGICCNLLLCTVKLAAGILAGSVAIMADALNNLSDASGPAGRSRPGGGAAGNLRHRLCTALHFGAKTCGPAAGS